MSGTLWTLFHAHRSDDEEDDEREARMFKMLALTLDGAMRGIEQEAEAILQRNRGAANDDTT